MAANTSTTETITGRWRRSGRAPGARRQRRFTLCSSTLPSPPTLASHCSLPSRGIPLVKTADFGVAVPWADGGGEGGGEAGRCACLRRSLGRPSRPLDIPAPGHGVAQHVMVAHTWNDAVRPVSKAGQVARTSSVGLSGRFAQQVPAQQVRAHPGYSPQCFFPGLCVCARGGLGFRV